MRKPTTLQLAKRPEQWLEIDDAIADNVKIICGRYDDPEQVRAFLTMLDLLTNRQYEISDRETVAFEAEKQAFQYAPECWDAQQAYMGKLKASIKEAKTA